MIVRLIATGRHTRMNDTINAGERRVQKMYRVSIQDICKTHGIAEGDMVEIWIRKIKED